MIISMRVLIVEDDQNLAETIKSGLEESGYAVDWVSDGFSGLDMVSAYSYDVIILDIRCPEWMASQSAKKYAPNISNHLSSS